VAIGIILVAILMASVLIPSLATLIGERLWWPGHAQPARTKTDVPATPHRRPRPTIEPAPARDG
jgi:RND superfamily putative drug exporter